MNPRATSTRSPAPVVSRRHSALVSVLFAAVMAGTTLPTPLYAIYSQRLGLTPFTVTVVFAAYAVAVLGTLLVLGRLSDHVGRRRVLLLSLGLSAVSELIFIGTFSLPGLFAGRLISGVSAGLITGSATAYLTELEAARPGRSRAGVIATVANMGGLGLGPVLSGVLAEHFAHPTVVPYFAGLVLLLPALLLFPLATPETVTRRDGWRAGTRPQRLGVPAAIRTPFLAAALAGLASFSLLGFTTALSGQVLAEGLGDHSHQTAGIVAGLLFGVAAVAQLATGLTTPRRAMLFGLSILPLGPVAILVAVLTSELPVLLAGVVIGGVGVGLSFRGALAMVNVVAPAERRGEVVSTFFVAAYVGLTVPVVGAGVLVTATSLTAAAAALTIFVIVLAVVAVTLVSRRISR